MTRPAATNSVLLAYFSRAGENYFHGDRTELDIGNTEVLAGMIRDRISCDVHRIEPVDPYPFDYEETVERNRNEQRNDARPVIADPLPSIGGHSIVLLASPVWNSSAPMIMHTFVESMDLADVTIHPITTHAVSGLSGVPSVYEELCPDATIGTGFTAQGEEVAEAGAALDEWLREIGSV
ncbi:flavodoxin [Rhodococcoides fascians]|uniref:flavodoxin n=1 Tax=Rhodococcoides fascians TaxID=1828 RepID=UPI00068A9207|nr:flavodoxin [Rhodococcus fascians]